MAFLSTAEIQVGSTEEFATGGQSSQVSAGDSLLYAFLAINVFNNVLLTALIGMSCVLLLRVLVPILGNGAQPSFCSGKTMVSQSRISQAIRYHRNLGQKIQRDYLYVVRQSPSCIPYAL